ncbi:radical SAM protein [Nanoarchaeota archaeon]
MPNIDLETLKKVWKYKLTRNFNEDEVFNVYVDSPFCFLPKCTFCIYKPTMIENKEGMLLKDKYYDKILIENIADFGDVLRLRRPDAVYFGGGTSSLMTIKQMEKIFEKFQEYFDFRSVRYKHFELNPLSATDEKIDLLLKWNFTRMSFGFQTFNQEVLKFNHRVNVSIDRMKAIFDKLEKADVAYNIDIMVFIYNDSLEEDLALLKNDLETVARELRPRRITVFPNYKKFSNTFSVENRAKNIQKIRSFREIVNKFTENSKYTNIHKTSERTGDEDILRRPLANPKLIREDVLHKSWTSYISTSPPNNPPKNQSVLAIGGFGIREPYSYIPGKLHYITHITESDRRFELRFADVRY